VSGRKKRPPYIPPGAPGHPFKPEDRKAPRGGNRGSSESEKRGRAGEERDERRGRPEAERLDWVEKRRRQGRRGEVQFLYEDENLVAVDKPEGLPVIAPEGSRAASLYDIVTDHIRQRNPRGRAAVVHRLDRDSSGVLVFAKNAETKRELMGNWATLARERRYVALVEGEIAEDSGRFESWLVEVGPNRVRVAEAKEKGALRAATDYSVIARGNGYSLLELSLETGRKHQIRAQLAASGHPIAGDARYGAHGDPAGRLCLHATLLILESPADHELHTFASPVPDSFARALRAGPKSRGAAASGKPRGARPGAKGARSSGAPREFGERGANAHVSSPSASARAPRNAAPRPRTEPRGKKPFSRP
jgi:23S rRNA pseudouridine1911/1915/1917 synthase